MEIAIQKLVALGYLVTGLSHIFQPRAWVDLFILLREKGAAGTLLNGLLHFQMGALIVSFHNVWSGIPMVITIMGWALVFKGFLYLVWPKYGMRSLSRVSVERAREFVAAGIVLVAIGGLIVYSLIDRGVLWKSF